MTRLLSYIFLSGILLFQFFSVFSQERVIHGKVTTLEEIPVVGAQVKVKSTRQVVMTDTLGMFSVGCMKKDKLKISAHGFITEKVKVGEKHKIILVNLRFRSDPESREVAVGYGHVSELDMLVPVSGMDEKGQDYSQFSDINDLIAAKFPDIRIIGGEYIIRGVRSLEGQNSALLVVDGMVVDEGTFRTIHVSHVAHIEILKGAAASVYGARGANGVILVETKTGGDR